MTNDIDPRYLWTEFAIGPNHRDEQFSTIASETVSTIANLKKELNQLDAVIDKGTGTEVEAEKRMEVLAALRNIDHIHSMDLAQKAKIKWSIEGDENSNFFHGILNKKRNQMNIRGITIDGVWKEQPNDVKQEFLSHFQDRFAKPSERRANIDMRFPKTISEDQSQDLEREVSKQEIKTAVWGCGTDKSSGPDGFSFGFYWHFWPVIEHDCPFYYLGTRVGGSMTRVQAWQEIVEKVKSRLSKWKSKTLSIGGRLTLLKSVLGSIPVFHMSIFKVPSKVLHILESIRSHFFNGHDPGSKKASWVKWNNVLTDKKRGGLGVSSLFALNRGLMIKWVWKFLSQKDSLWTKVIVAIHGVGGKIHSEWTSTGKSCWLSILSEVRSLQRKGMYVFDYLTHKMGNGESTKFWLDHWHTRGIFKDIFPRLYALESSKDVTVSSKIGDTSLVCSFRRIPRGGIEQNQFDSLVELVRSVTIVPSADRWNWNLESTGIFSVASARRRIDEICLPNIGEETRWVKCVPIKINVLAWKIKTDALPTRFNISRRGIDIQDMSCPICDNAIESTDHLFFRCGLVRDIANKVLSWWNLDHANLNSYAEWKSWLVSIRMDSKLKKMFEGVWRQGTISSSKTREKEMLNLSIFQVNAGTSFFYRQNPDDSSTLVHLFQLGLDVFLSFIKFKLLGVFTKGLLLGLAPVFVELLFTSSFKC
ncbi:RNA-directed DNA polymerase, eukaryota, reverse transcriptase zinc-binding domain protein [Tanacetum coccineum]